MSYGVMAAHLILVQRILVRIQVGQQINSPEVKRLRCPTVYRYGAGSTPVRTAIKNGK